MRQAVRLEYERLPGQNTIRSEYKLNQKHVADRPARDGKEHLPLPQMQKDDEQDGDQFRYAVASGKQVHIPQAVDHQQAEYGGREHPSQIPNVFRRGLSGGKDEKRKKTGQHRSQDDHADRDEPL